MTRTVDIGAHTDGVGAPKNQPASGKLTPEAPTIPLAAVASRVARTDTTVLITGQTGVARVGSRGGFTNTVNAPIARSCP